MLRGAPLAILIIVIAVFAYEPDARAACVAFSETPTGEALLVNHCDVAVDVGYLVGAEGGVPDPSGHLYRSSVGPDSSKILWTRANPPIPGRYQIKIFSCTAPTVVVFEPGGPPTCRISVATEG